MRPLADEAFAPCDASASKLYVSITQCAATGLRSSLSCLSAIEVCRLNFNYPDLVTPLAASGAPTGGWGKVSARRAFSLPEVSPL
jgi:hypothetical protein